MSNITAIRITLAPDARVPERGSAGASGYDLHATTDVLIKPGQIAIIPSGVSLELPDGWEAQVRPRSGMSSRGLWVSLGTVDADYRGVVCGTLINLGRDDARIRLGDRFAQLVFARVEHVAFDVSLELSRTQRGSGGFGSSGR